MNLPQFTIKHTCPYCGHGPEMVKEPIEQQNGYFNMRVECQNMKCPIQPHTKNWDTRLHSEKECILGAIKDWDTRDGQIHIGENPVTNIDMRENLGGRYHG